MWYRGRGERDAASTPAQINGVPLSILGRRPFIEVAFIDRSGGQRTTLRGIDISLDRVVAGALGRDSWVPEGVKLLADGTVISSAEYVGRLALSRAYMHSQGSNILLSPFNDPSGGSWLRVVDGRHRVTAAMLNNEATLNCDVLQSVHPDTTQIDLTRAFP